MQEYKIENTAVIRVASLVSFAAHLTYSSEGESFSSELNKSFQRISMRNMIALHDAETFEELDNGMYGFFRDSGTRIGEFEFEEYLAKSAFYSKIVHKCKLTTKNKRVDGVALNRVDNSHFVKFTTRTIGKLSRTW